MQLLIHFPELLFWLFVLYPSSILAAVQWAPEQLQIRGSDSSQDIQAPRGSQRLNLEAVISNRSAGLA